MKELVTRGANGRLFQILSDDRTVWVNDDHGSAVGRFSATGVDVHVSAEEQMERGQQCLDCVAGEPFKPPRRSLWERFRASMLFFYGVEVPGDLVRNLREDQD